MTMNTLTIYEGAAGLGFGAVNPYRLNAQAVQAAIWRSHLQPNMVGVAPVAADSVGPSTGEIAVGAIAAILLLGGIAYAASR